MLYPTYIIEGENYPLPFPRSLLSSIVGFLQMGLIIFSFAGNRVDTIRDHPLYHKFEENRFVYLIGLYFGLNILQNNISSTGAF